MRYSYVSYAWNLLNYIIYIVYKSRPNSKYHLILRYGLNVKSIFEHGFKMSYVQRPGNEKDVGMQLFNGGWAVLDTICSVIHSFII